MRCEQNSLSPSSAIGVVPSTSNTLRVSSQCLSVLPVYSQGSSSLSNCWQQASKSVWASLISDIASALGLPNKFARSIGLTLSRLGCGQFGIFNEYKAPTWNLIPKWINGFEWSSSIAYGVAAANGDQCLDRLVALSCSDKAGRLGTESSVLKELGWAWEIDEFRRRAFSRSTNNNQCIEQQQRILETVTNWSFDILFEVSVVITICVYRWGR